MSHIRSQAKPLRANGEKELVAFGELQLPRGFRREDHAEGVSNFSDPEFEHTDSKICFTYVITLRESCQGKSTTRSGSANGARSNEELEGYDQF